MEESLGNGEHAIHSRHRRPQQAHRAVLPVRGADILASARRNLVVRDGTASFFYHPYL
jgi:hypothetical protein